MNQPPTSQSDGPGSGRARYDPHPGLAALGTCVEVEMVSELGDSERLTFDIVPTTRPISLRAFWGPARRWRRRSWADRPGASCRTGSVTWPRCASWR